MRRKEREVTDFLEINEVFEKSFVLHIQIIILVQHRANQQIGILPAPFHFQQGIQDNLPDILRHNQSLLLRPYNRYSLRS